MKGLELSQSKEDIDDDDFNEAVQAMDSIVAKSQRKQAVQESELSENSIHFTKQVANFVINLPPKTLQLTCPPRPKRTGRPQNTSLKSWNKYSKLETDSRRSEDERLSLLDLAPGGHLGRFAIWTASAFKKLEQMYGSFDAPSQKKGFVLRPKMTNPDLGRIVNSDEVQSVVNPKKEVKHREKLNNMELNPFLSTSRKMATFAEAARLKRTKLSLVDSQMVEDNLATGI